MNFVATRKCMTTNFPPIFLFFWIRDPWGKNPDPGSGINILDPQHGSKLFFTCQTLFLIFVYNLVKVVNSTFYWTMQILTLTCFFCSIKCLWPNRKCTLVTVNSVSNSIICIYSFWFSLFSSYDESIEVKVELPAFSPGANSPASDEPDNDNFDKPEEPEDVKESSPKGSVKKKT